MQEEAWEGCCEKGHAYEFPEAMANGRLFACNGMKANG